MDNAETAVEKEERDVLELYGGIESVTKRMTVEVKKGLDKKIKEIQEDLLPSAIDKMSGRIKNYLKLLKFEKSKGYNNIQKYLKRKYSDEEVLEAISKRLYVPYKKFKNILDGKEKVDYAFFDRLQIPLNIGILDTLGKPNLSNPKTRAYWLKEPEEHRIGPCPPGMNYDSQLDLYFGLRAISRLRELSDEKYKKVNAA